MEYFKKAGLISAQVTSHDTGGYDVYYHKVGRGALVIVNVPREVVKKTSNQSHWLIMIALNEYV